MHISCSTLLRLIFAVSIGCLLPGCFRTTPQEEIQELVADGFTITWTSQRGEYWDEFSARKEKQTKQVLVNRTKVKRSPEMSEGDPNTVQFLDDGTLEVQPLDE